MGILNMQSKSVVVMFLILVPTYFCSLADKAEAALACYNCHGTNSTMDIRPEDAPFRNVSSGGFRGNHRTHMGAGSAAVSCARYVIMNYADMLDLTFPALPTPEAGMTRGFILKADNYYKEFKEYKYLEPLPFHGMSDYPPPPPEAYPTDEDHNQYRLLYNTRVVAP